MACCSGWIVEYTLKHTLIDQLDGVCWCLWPCNVATRQFPPCLGTACYFLTIQPRLCSVSSQQHMIAEVEFFSP